MLHLTAGSRFISVFISMFFTHSSRPTRPEIWVLQREGLLLRGSDQTRNEINHAATATMSANYPHKKKS